MTETDFSLMDRAIRLAEECKPSKLKIPKVGAVIAVGGTVLGMGVRGTGNDGDDDHAELVAIRNVGDRGKLPHATAYTTLEPCTPFVRSQGHNCCTEHLKRAEISKVFIGILDPNQGVCGKGVLELQRVGIEVELFPPRFAQRVRLINEPFILTQQSYSIKIVSPRPGETIRTYDRGGTYDFEGECTNLPGDDVFAILNKGSEWWPQPHSFRQTGDKRWAVTVHFGNYGAHSIYIVKADELGSALIRYYRKVSRLNGERKAQLRGHIKVESGREESFLRTLHGDYPGIEMGRLPKGLELQDRIDVIVERPPDPSK